MKEKEFMDYISTVDTDFSMDQKVLEQIFNNSEAANKNNIFKFTNTISNLKERFQIMRTLPKVAALLTILVIVGTATVFAQGYLVKVFSPKIIYKESEGAPANIKVIDKTYIKGSEPLTNEYGGIIGYNRIPGAAEEAFALFNLPNLIPTYLLENYYTDSDGYVYTENLADHGFTFNNLRAYFTSDVQLTKRVFFWFTPEDQSVKDLVFYYTNISSENITQTTYITKSGLPCIIEDFNKANHFLNVFILFDSDTLGNGFYRLEFSPNIEMEEVEEILDSIPLTSSGELINGGL